MSDPPVCKVCGKPCSAHTVHFRWGVAHAGTWDANARFNSCSERYAEYEHNWGRRQELETLIRSLRWHAGRLRSRNAVWTAEDLIKRSDQAVKLLEMLQRHVAEYWPWAEMKD